MASPSTSMSDNTVEHVSTCLICWGGDGKQKDSGDKHCDDSDCLLSLECSTETPHMVHRSCLLKYFHHASDSSNPQFSCLACFRPLSLNFITRHFPEQAFLALLQKVSVPAVFWKLTNHDVCSIISDFLALPQTTKGNNHYDMRMTMMKFLYAWVSSKTMFAPTCAASSRSTPIHAASSRTLSSHAASSRAISSSAILEKKLILVIQACLLWNGNPDFTTASDGITEITNQAVALLNVLFSHPEIYPSFKHKMIKFICSLLQGKLYTQQHDEANQNEEQEQQHNIQEQYIQLGRKILALVSHNCADSIIQHGKIKLGELIMQAFAEQDYHGALLLCYRKLLPNPQTALEKDDDKVWEGILREIQALPPDITLYNLQNVRIFLSYLVQGNMTSVQSAMGQMDRIWARYKNEASVQQEIFYFSMAVFGFCSLHDKRRVFSWLAESILPENFHAQIAYQQTRLLLQTLLYHHGREFMSEINTISARLAEEQQCLVDQAELYFQLPQDQQQERQQDYQAALPLLLAHVVLAQMMFTRTGTQYVKDEFILNLIDDRSTHDEMRIVGWLLAIQVQKIQPKQRLYLFDMPTLLDKLKNARSIDLVLAVLIYIHFADGLEHNREIAQILLQHYNALQVSEQYQFAFDMSLVLKEQKLLLPGVLEFVKLLAARIQTQEENGGGADGRLVHSSVVGVLLKGLLPFLHACDVSWVEPALYAISAIQFYTWNDCVAVFVSFILRGWFSKSQYETCLAYCDYNQEEEERRKYSRFCIPMDFTCIRNQLEAAWAQTSKLTWQVKHAAERMTTFFKNCFSKRKS